jgi:ubiquinone biosynthesis UbiH/UbiF/VisC/COQ6 family hydroxylase
MNAAAPQPLYDVAVVGRGPVGAAAALALSRTGLKVACVGPRAEAPPPAAGAEQPWDARVFALSAGARRLLGGLGVWDALDASRVAPVYDMRIYPSAEPGAPELHFDAYEARVEALAWIVEGSNLAATFERALSFAPVAAHEASLAALAFDEDPRAAVLSLDDGTRLRARLVVGADGGQSATRRLAGIAADLHDYPQTAVVANFATGAPHRDGAWQWFGAHGILALLPLPGARCSMVWSAPHALADELMALPAEALAARVRAIAGERLGALAVITPAARFPLRRISPASMIGPRLALVGDAAHVVHPLAGQGMNLGFGDVAELAAVMTARESFRDPGDRLLLRRYERARREAVAAMRWTTDGLQKLFDPAIAQAWGPVATPVGLVRDLGWRAVAASGWLRRQLVAAAAD